MDDEILLMKPSSSTVSAKNGDGDEDVDDISPWRFFFRKSIKLALFAMHTSVKKKRI